MICVIKNIIVRSLLSSYECAMDPKYPSLSLNIDIVIHNVNNVNKTPIKNTDSIIKFI